MVALKSISSAFAAAIFLGSCGNDGGTAASDVIKPQGVQRVKSGDGFDDDSDAIKEKYGSINASYTNGGSASESGKKNSQYDREIANREFSAKDYSKKSFWGSKDYAKKVYGGDLDGSRFQQASRLGSEGAREETMAFRDGTRGFKSSEHTTSSAREQDGRRLDRPADAETNFRRSVYKQPEVTDWHSQRALSVEDTRGMLGR